MFCSRCGAEQPESARFCERCGHRHEVVPPQRAGRWWIGGAVALALALAGAAVLAATGTFESDDAGNNRVETESAPAPSTVPDTAPDTTAERAEPSPETDTEAAAGGEQPVRATVQRTCGPGGVGGDCVLSVRAEPTAASAEIDVLDEGDSLRLSCQVRGEPVYSSVLGDSSNVWSRTTQGGYVANVYVAGPGLSPGQITLAPC
jgi:zinc-ribbon domain